MRVARIVGSLVVAVCIGLACSGGSSTTDGGGLCNGAACAAGQYCINPCCGGAGPVCTPIPDGGVCPQGTVQLANCPPTAAPGCQQTCDAPAPYCSATLPAGCSVDSTTGEVVCVSG